MDRIYSYDEKAVDVSRIDIHASLASPEDAKTFDSLINYIKEGIRDELKPHNQLVLARGLLAWMALGHIMLDISADGDDSEMSDSPINLLTLIQFGNKCRVSVYESLCRHAGIYCLIVEGRAKTVVYKAGDGDSEDLQGHLWTIIVADGQQHLVHPNFATIGIVGLSHGGEMLLESDGEFKGQIQSRSAGEVIRSFNEEWFCTHPKIFVNHCLPDNPEYQLLPVAERIKTVDEFYALPHLTKFFYYSRLSLMTEKTCSLKSKKGKCQISLLADTTNSIKINFSYKLSLISPIDVKLDAKDMPLLVLFSRSMDVFEFEIRFPIVGEYRFKLFVCHDNEIQGRCCEFRINCTEVDSQCKRLPIESGIEGYGYGPTAESAGLKKPSMSTGKIYVKPPTSKANTSNKDLNFQVDEDAVYKKKFVSDVYSVDKAGNTVTHKESSKAVLDPSSCKMSVVLTIPDAGEYAVVIGARDTLGGSRSVVQNIAKYFVSTDETLGKDQRKMKQRKREAKKENRIQNKKSEIKILEHEFDNLQTEITALESNQVGENI